MECPVANRLLKRYSKAVIALREAQLPLLLGLVAPGPDYARVRKAVIQADAARRDLWQHIQKHGCSYLERSDYSRATKIRLRTQMQKARRVFDSASEKYDYLVLLAERCPETPASEAGISLEEAQRIPMRAFEVYSDALRRYADYVVFGRLPDVPHTHVLEPVKPN